MTHDFTTLAGIKAAAKELNDLAHKAGLEFWFDMEFHWEFATMRITKGIDPGCQDIWGSCTRQIRIAPEALAAKMQEAAEALAKYQDDRIGGLENEVAELADKLKAAKAELRKLKKGGKA